MGIIDDYYGGYENLALFTDEYGSIDFEAAYGKQAWPLSSVEHVNCTPVARLDATQLAQPDNIQILMLGCCVTIHAASCVPVV